MAAPAEPEKYEVLKTIGQGSFGVIRKVRRKSDGYVLCRKEILYIKMSHKEREQLHAEFSILNSLKHPNIVGYYHREHLKQTQELFLYMEYCGGGDLGQEIKRLNDSNQYADEQYVWSIFSQIIAALYRCHYGSDPPEVGSITGKRDGPRQTGLKGKNAVMILHRDLKPENGEQIKNPELDYFSLYKVFLGADNSVKLGDFGLSKLMQSHDFASTYVGTPFYMSPEICAAERYTLHSDIWSLGCVMYELCARTQPFKGRDLLELVQKIKAGRLQPLPSIYSQDLQHAIKSCLNVNPLKRPDTASLLELPAVRLVRKEREMVELGRILKDKEEQARQKTLEAEAKAIHLHNDKEQIRTELEATMRREWEVKAGLEISRQVQLEKDRLSRVFEKEVATRVKAEVERQLRSRSTSQCPLESGQTSPKDEPHFSSVSTAADTDFPSTTDLSNLSLDSLTVGPAPELTEERSKTPPKPRARGPLARARTQFDSPMDIPMVDPSPMSIQGLSLSPRQEGTKASAANRNIFVNAARIPQPRSPRASLVIEDDEDNLPDLPSPTRRPSLKQLPRPGLLRQKTAPMNRLGPRQPTLFAPTAAEQQSRVPSPPRPKPSGFSPVRKAPPKPSTSGAENEMFKAVMQRNLHNTGGRTLVELAQARAGRPSQAQIVEKSMMSEDRKENVVVWDPERDEMPSPFLARGGKSIKRL